MGDFPDALIFPESSRVGRNFHERITSMAKLAESMLGLDYAKGGRAFVRKATAGIIFISADPHDTIYFPTSHARSGEARYRWVAGENDVRLGYLIQE